MPFPPSTLISTLRYEPPVAPSPQIFQEAAVEAFPMAIVGFAVAFSVAKVYSVKHDYTIDGNQVCNGATSKCYCEDCDNKVWFLSDLVVGADSFWAQQYLWSFLQVLCSEYISF